MRRFDMGNMIRKLFEIQGFLLNYMPVSRRDDELLSQAGDAIVRKAGRIGVFHYNKLLFLFEYRFITNFGHRFTKELFIKLPHGPVIHDYKTFLREEHRRGLLLFDINEFNKARKLCDDYYERITIEPSMIEENRILQNPILNEFIEQLVEKYAGLTVTELERKVYQTQLMQDFSSSAYKGEGSYIINSDLIRQGDFKTRKSDILNQLLTHYEKNPEVNDELQELYLNEFDYLRALRPAFD